MPTRHRIIGPEMLGGIHGSRINGPSCIEVPLGVANRLGRYYLYFADHRGDYIRLAYASHPLGPWKIYAGEVLHLADLPQCRDHIASPDVIVDRESGEIRIYFHGVDAESGTQRTFVASSTDGLRFTALPHTVGPFYLRVVKWRDLWIGMSKGGLISISNDGKTGFRPLKTSAFPMSSPKANMPGDTRHVALDLEDDRLWVYFSRIGDAPEHIRLGYVDLLRPLDQWKVEASIPLLKPEQEWEGAGLPVVPSKAGPARPAENALRDPAILKTDEGRWLYYSFAGEQGIAAVAMPRPAELYVMQSNAPARNSGAAATSRTQQIRVAYDNLSRPGALEQKLIELDGPQPRQRIYLMGCGRSGTWLLTSLMTCFEDTEVIAKELPVEAFGILKTSRPNVALKRIWNAYARIDFIPQSVGIIHIVRHPFDVLTSYNPTTQRKYHISPARWVDEMRALKQLMESGRPNLLVLSYEKLVRDPQSALSQIAGKFGLSQSKSASEGLGGADLPPEAVAAMHGVRPIDQQSVARFRNDPANLEYLRGILPELGEMLPWVAQAFGYDVALHEIEA